MSEYIRLAGRLRWWSDYCKNTLKDDYGRALADLLKTAADIIADIESERNDGK